MNSIKIKKVTITDIEQLQKIGRDTFFETFYDSNTEENMKKYLEINFSLKNLAKELKKKDNEFYFALKNNKVIGYLKLNFGSAQTELKNENTVEIERIYVLKIYHGKNIAQFLLEKAIEISNKKNVNYIWLGVWEKNIRAIKFYQKNNFIAFDKHIFKLGDDEQNDIMMKLTLRN